MARRVEYIPTTPDVLRWARLERQMSLLQAAEAIGIAEAELEAIESGAALVSAAAFRGMMRAYGRSESVLLLPDVPPDALPITDHRAASRRRQAPVMETIEALREGRMIQALVSELVAEERELLFPAVIPPADETDSPEEVARRERVRLRATIEMQRRWAPRRESLNGWRAFLQERGILVLSKDIPRDDCRGAALTGPGLVPLIMVTTDDSYAGRIFTMFHEYAHLVRRSASYCAVDSADTESTERWCDHFAAAFLMPRDEMLRLKDERAYRELGPDDWSMNDIERAARAFRVSPFAMARRLRDLGIATFFTRHGDELWQRDQLARRAPRPDQRGGGPASPLSAVRELGTAAAGAITEGLHRGLVDRTEFVTILGIRGNQLSDFETRLSEQRRRESA